MMKHVAAAPFNYLNARPGYEVHSLLITVNLLAENGQQQAREAVISSGRMIYSRFTAGVHGESGSIGDDFSWRQQQIATAMPVEDITPAVRSDQLIDTEVRSAHGVGLGSVHDPVIAPRTGRIA